MKESSSISPLRVQLGHITSEEVCILTHDVWYNTIFEERDFDTNPYTQDASGSFNEDFNDSIKALFSGIWVANFSQAFAKSVSYVLYDSV